MPNKYKNKNKKKPNLASGNNRLRALIQEVILAKNLIKTGDLHRSIDAKFTIDKKDNLTVKIGAIFYYKYLDDGTRTIAKRDITKDTVNSPKFKKIMEDVAADYVEYLLITPE